MNIDILSDEFVHNVLYITNELQDLADIVNNLDIHDIYDEIIENVPIEYIKNNLNIFSKLKFREIKNNMDRTLQIVFLNSDTYNQTKLTIERTHLLSRYVQDLLPKVKKHNDFHILNTFLKCLEKSICDLVETYIIFVSTIINETIDMLYPNLVYGSVIQSTLYINCIYFCYLAYKYVRYWDKSDKYIRMAKMRYLDHLYEIL